MLTVQASLMIVIYDRNIFTVRPQGFDPSVPYPKSLLQCACQGQGILGIPQICRENKNVQLVKWSPVARTISIL
jgi:hypothetical protein